MDVAADDFCPALQLEGTWLEVERFILENLDMSKLPQPEPKKKPKPKPLPAVKPMPVTKIKTQKRY